MRDRNFTTIDGLVNLHHTRGTQLKAFGNGLKHKNFSKKVTGKKFKFEKGT